jgi:hypothetical protein
MDKINLYNIHMKVVLISGDRDWYNVKLIREWLKKLKSEGFDTIIEGEARGADIISRMSGEDLGFKILDRDSKTKGFPAEWNKYHRAAGPIRNSEMLKVGKPELVVAFHNSIETSKGTKNMINQAVKAKIKTILVSDGKSEIIEKIFKD